MSPALSDAELLALLRNLESDRVERKRALSDRDKVKEAICAFSNDMPDHRAPGVLFVGVEDDGSRADLNITDALLTTLAQLRDDGTILPLPSMTVQRHELDGCPMAVIVVQPSTSLPVRFDGRVRIRIGPRRATATPEEERQLLERQVAFTPPFDARPAVGASLEDLDQSYFREEYLPRAIAPDVLAQNGRPLDHQLKALHLMSMNSCPTHAGLVIGGIDTTSWLPGAFVQFVRFAGTNLDDPIVDEKRLSGRLGDILRRIDEVCDAHNAVAVDLSASPEHRRRQYPPIAIQQIVRNAIMHRNYEGTNAPIRVYWFDDRVEVHSPGGPYGQVTRDNFGQPYASDYRNPHIAEAMRTLGYVQRFGVGIAVARRALTENGNPDLEFDVQPTAVLAVLRRPS